MCCTVEGSHQLGSRSRHRGAASNPCLIFRSIILPAAIMPGIGFWLAHLQEMTISCTQGIRSIHEFRHILITDVQHPLQHARHLLLGSLSLSRNGHLDFQRGILMNRHIMMDSCSNGYSLSPPNFSIDWTFFPKKGASMAISSGRYSSMIPVTRSKILPNRR